jgi:hypothetical protein
MCKFHKDVAIAVAANPSTGDIDPVRYSLTLGALSRLWINKYMPSMGHLDGYSNYELSTTEAREAFLASDLPKDVRSANDNVFERRDFVRAVIDDYIVKHQIDRASLNLPKDPYKKPAFLDGANADIYEGSPAGPRDIKLYAEKPEHEPLRRAMDELFKQDGFLEAIDGLLQTSISNLMIDAPRQVNQTRLSIYDRLPFKLRSAFGSCSLHAGGGALAHVAICGGLNVAIGGFSSTFMNAAMYAFAPAVAVGTTYGVEKFKKNNVNEYKYVLPVVLALAAAFGASKIFPHEHSTDPRMEWFYSLNAPQRYDQLQKDYQRYLKLPEDLQRQVDEEASKQKMTPSMFMTSLEVCGGDLTPKIRAFEASNAQQMELSKQELR